MIYMKRSGIMKRKTNREQKPSTATANKDQFYKEYTFLKNYKLLY